MSNRKPVVLTIAGSDSSGGAGIQADLQTFLAMGIHGACAVTCLTAQSPCLVSRIEPVNLQMIHAQVTAVFKAFRPSVVKVGMVYSPEIISAVAQELEQPFIEQIVIDPVMKSSSGAALVEESALEPLCNQLLPKATVITPNIYEAEVLSDNSLQTVDDVKAAAEVISSRFNTACVIKGGHLADRSGVATDVLYAVSIKKYIKVFSLKRVPAVNVHGTGCIFSSALSVFLASGHSLPEAVRLAKEYVTQGLKIAENRKDGFFDFLEAASRITAFKRRNAAERRR